MTKRKTLLLFGAFLLATALSVIVRFLDARKVKNRRDASAVDLESDG